MSGSSTGLFGRIWQWLSGRASVDGPTLASETMTAARTLSQTTGPLVAALEAPVAVMESAAVAPARAPSMLAARICSARKLNRVKRRRPGLRRRKSLRTMRVGGPVLLRSGRRPLAASTRVLKASMTTRDSRQRPGRVGAEIIRLPAKPRQQDLKRAA